MNESFTNNSGIEYPPKNNIAVIQLNKTIELYSALNLVNKIKYYNFRVYFV